LAAADGDGDDDADRAEEARYSTDVTNVGAVGKAIIGDQDGAVAEVDAEAVASVGKSLTVQDSSLGLFDASAFGRA
jgi:hypothetical protein